MQHCTTALTSQLSSETDYSYFDLPEQIDLTAEETEKLSDIIMKDYLKPLSGFSFDGMSRDLPGTSERSSNGSPQPQQNDPKPHLSSTENACEVHLVK